MTAFLLIGVIRDGAQAPCAIDAPPHHRVRAAGWIGLAIGVDADVSMDEADRTLALAEQQHVVLAQYIKSHDVLPIALGAAFSSTDAIAAHLRDTTHQIGLLFDRIEGRCEFLLHLSLAVPQSHGSVETSEGGAAFLRKRQTARDARRALAERRDAFRQSVKSYITSFSQDSRARPVAGPDLLSDHALLVDRTDIGPLAASLKARSAESDALGIAMRLVGPLPAYSFVAREFADA